MKNHLLLLLAAGSALLVPAAAGAQVVTTTPAIVQSDSENIVITYHADRGNGELARLTAADKVYAHTGLITSKSSSPSDWKHACTWGSNDAKYQMTYAGPSTWTLTIPSIAEYYGVSAGETVQKLAFVFRNATGSLQGKTAEGGDIFVDVLPEGRQAVLSCSEPDGVLSPGVAATATFITTAPAMLTLSIDGDEVAASPGEATELVYTLDFNESGDHTLTALADFGDLRLTEEMTISVVGNGVAAEYPGGIPVPGAVRDDADGSVTFCLPAPGKESVVLVGAWDDYRVLASRVMNYQDYDGQRYFWTTVSGLQEDADYPYYYLVDRTARVGDPYARLVLDPYNDRYISSSVFPDMPPYPSDKVQNVYLAVYNSASDDYEWQYDDLFTRPSQQSLVIYELLIRDFTGAEGKASGSGTIAGVMDKLDYLQELGVNAIELLPIMEFDGNNSWGYNTNFYFAPDKAYGTPADYRALIDECHRRGMAVILDIVFNQTAGGHPWYQMYPIDANPMYNGSAPHAYSVLNDWNQDHPLVLRQEQDAIRYWLEAYHVDGFRFDLVKGLGLNASYNNTYYPATNTFGTPSESATNAFNQSRVDRMAELHAAMREVAPTAYFINENLAGAQEENAMAADGDLNWANVNDASCQFAMGWQSNSSLNRFWAPLDGSRALGSTVSYAESHDEERMAYKQVMWGVPEVKGSVDVAMRRLGSVAAQMLVTPGSHMIWQFQEFGADQTTKTSSGNDTSPKKVVWSYLRQPARYDLLRVYKELIATRMANPELFDPEKASVSVNLSGWEKGRTVVLEAGGKKAVLAVNPEVSGNVTVATGVAGLADMQVLSASKDVDFTISGDAVTLAPGAFVLLGSKELVGVDGVAADDACDDAPARYYNLQGQPVAHPAAGGFYIRVKGRDASVVRVAPR